MPTAVVEKTKKRHILGSLYVSNKEAAANPFVRNRLYYSFTINNLRFLITPESKWSDNHITFNSVSNTTGTVTEAMEILTSLKTVLNTEDALTLGIKGRFSMVFESKEEPLVFRVEVKHGEVSYQQAEYVWPVKTVL